MATIKAGTYILRNTLDFSMLTSDNTIQYSGNNITIGDVVFDGGAYFSIYINKNGTITHNDVSWVEGMNGAGAITYTFYNGSWTDEKYRTWVFAGDYEVGDKTATWFNSNLYVPEAKFVRLIREDGVATYDGSYNVTENGTVLCANKMMTQDLTVNVESSSGSTNVLYNESHRNLVYAMGDFYGNDECYLLTSDDNSTYAEVAVNSIGYIENSPRYIKIRFYSPGGNGGGDNQVEIQVSRARVDSLRNDGNSSGDLLTPTTLSPTSNVLNGSYREIVYDLGSSTGYLYSVLVGTVYDIGCFVEGTLINLADGTTKPIEDITYDDVLLTWDFDKADYGAQKPCWIARAAVAPCYWRVGLSNGTVLKLVGTDGKSHRLYNATQGKFVYPQDFNENDTTIITCSDTTVKIVSCEEVYEPVTYYNLMTELDINCYAEGVLTGNRLCNIYPIDNMQFVKVERPLASREDYAEVPDKLFYGLRIAEQPVQDNCLDNVNYYPTMKEYIIHNIVEKDICYRNEGGVSE